VSAVGLVLAALGVWLGTVALLVAALAHVRDDEQEARLGALERDAASAGELGPLPAEVEPEERRPIGFRRE
jgi:hypothetical protein